MKVGNNIISNDKNCGSSPLLHLIATDGCFSGDGMYTKGPDPVAKDLEELFRYAVLNGEGKINDAAIENMLCRHHSGFNEYCGPTMISTK